MDLLIALLFEAGRPVSKAQLIEAAWGTRAVESSNLTVQIAALRQVLGAASEYAAEPTLFIQTIPGFGYVFSAPVEGEWEADGQAHGRKPASGVGRPVVPVSAAPQTWLAEPPTLFIGRERELLALRQLLQTNRLVTLTGIGGVGKTRLTMRLCHEVKGSYASGVTFVDLAP